MKKKEIVKSDDFLSQIPDWEVDYKNSKEAEIDFKKEDWKNATANFTDKDLFIFGCAVMEDWETPYMKVLADICTENGGIVLELGYGMGISAKFIQEHSIRKHIIVEANHEVADKAREFSKSYQNETLILEGFWEEVIDDIEDNSLDGILFDTYPLEDSELYQNHFNFFPYAFRKLKPGGIFTYYSDEIKSFGEVHMRKLIEAGFKKDNINAVPVSVTPPADCEYWKANTILAPKITK